MCDEHFEEDLAKYMRPGDDAAAVWRVVRGRRHGDAVAARGGRARRRPSPRSPSRRRTARRTATSSIRRAAAIAGVIVWPDILGLRPAFRQMGKRLAESGYSVLVVNPFYRQKHAPVVPAGANFADTATRNIVMPLAQALNATTHATDAKAFVACLDTQAAVDKTRKIGTTGYCMGGPIVMRTAAAVPARVGAGASFHGGGLVTQGARQPASADSEDEGAVPVLRRRERRPARAGLEERAEGYVRESASCRRRSRCTPAPRTAGARPDSAVYNEGAGRARVEPPAGDVRKALA